MRRGSVRCGCKSCLLGRSRRARPCAWTPTAPSSAPSAPHRRARPSPAYRARGRESRRTYGARRSRTCSRCTRKTRRCQLPTRTPDAGEAHVPVEAREVAAPCELRIHVELRHEATLIEPLAGGAAERRDAEPVLRPPQRLHAPPTSRSGLTELYRPNGCSSVLEGTPRVLVRCSKAKATVGAWDRVGGGRTVSHSFKFKVLQHGQLPQVAGGDALDELVAASS